MTKYYSIHNAPRGGYVVSPSSRPSSAEAVILGAGMKPDFAERHRNDPNNPFKSYGYGGVTNDMFLIQLQYLEKRGMLFFTEAQGKAIVRGMKAANAQGLEGKTIKALLDYETLVGVNTGK